ncbi:uncharacterized protein [Cebidichthys violaceus]|uniref:uncharacterized protein n=1 Tax=Cebidichthys violaceus TaxID=271503 RepID=UPI0035CA9C04
MAEDMIPPILNKRAANNNKGSNQTLKETECTPANQEKSPPKKRRVPSTSSTVESAGAAGDVSMLFSKFAEVLSEIAAADTHQMKELESILTEAQNLESHLKENKKRLRQTLSLISDKLQG